MRYRLLICIVLTQLSFACKNRDQQLYVISRQDSIRKAKHTTQEGIVIMPPMMLQGGYNFLIDDKGKLYFYKYKFPVRVIGFMGDDSSNDFKPIPLNRLKIIPSGDEERFLAENIFDTNSLETSKAVTIASVNDTVNNRIIPLLQKAALDTSNHIDLKIRHTVDVEEIALTKIK